MKMKFYVCTHCGNIVAFANDAGVPIVCCGQKMAELVPNTVEASVEKHLPVISQEGNIVTVTVGSVDHPMGEEHLIDWVALETQQGNQRKQLIVDGEPKVQCALVEGDAVVAAYAYCNLHGLWKTEA